MVCDFILSAVLHTATAVPVVYDCPSRHPHTLQPVEALPSSAEPLPCPPEPARVHLRARALYRLQRHLSTLLGAA